MMVELKVGATPAVEQRYLACRAERGTGDSASAGLGSFHPGGVGNVVCVCFGASRAGQR